MLPESIKIGSLIAFPTLYGVQVGRVLEASGRGLLMEFRWGNFGPRFSGGVAPRGARIHWFPWKEMQKWFDRHDYDVLEAAS